MPTRRRTRTSRWRANSSRAGNEDSMARYILRRLAYSLLSMFLLSLTIFFFVRVTGDPAMLLVEPGASQADIDAVRERFGLDRPLWVQYWSFMVSVAAGRLRPVVLLPHAGPRALFLAPAELAAPGAGCHGLLAPDRHPEWHPRRRAGRPLLGQGGKDLLALGPLAPLVLGRPRADPLLLRLPGVAAVVGLRHRLAPAHAGLRARLVLRRRAYAAHALLHARGAGLGVHQARPSQGPA